jgi:1,4-dihydroxy-2-naphthoyl-CoA hydrolase
MPIWFQKAVVLEDLEKLSAHTMVEYLGLRWVEIGDDYLKLAMPVNHTTRQPYGFLHGGASCVLAETIGSVGSALVMDRERFYCVGVEINASHLRSVSEGKVTATARPLRLGKSIHVWDIRIHDDQDRLFCVSRLTVAILLIKK